MSPDVCSDLVTCYHVILKRTCMENHNQKTPDNCYFHCQHVRNPYATCLLQKFQKTNQLSPMIYLDKIHSICKFYRETH